MFDDIELPDTCVTPRSYGKLKYLAKNYSCDVNRCLTEAFKCPYCTTINITQSLRICECIKIHIDKLSGTSRQNRHAL